MASLLEQVSRDLNAAGFAIDKLDKTFDNFQLQSCSILNLAEQWRNLQVSLGEVHKSVESRVKEMELKERENCIVAYKLHSFQNEVELKRKHLEVGEKLLSEKIAKVELSQNEVKKWFEVIEVQNRGISERRKAIKEKERELAEGMGRVKKFESELNEWRKEVELEESRVNKVAKELESRQEQFDKRCEEVELREIRVDERIKGVGLRETGVNEEEIRVKKLESELDEWRKAVELEESRVNEVAEEVENRQKQINERLASLEAREEEINKRRHDIEIKEMQVDAQCTALEKKEGVLNDQWEYLELKLKHLEEHGKAMELKEKEVEELHQGLEEKEKKMNEGLEDLESRQKQIDEQFKEVGEMEKEISECYKDIEITEKQLNRRKKVLDLRDKQFEESSKALELKVKEVDGCCQMVEQKEKQLNELSKDLELKEMQLNEVSLAQEAKEKEQNELSHTLELKEKQLNELSKKLELKEKQLNEVFRAQEAKEKQQNEFSHTLELKEKQINELSESLVSKQEQFNKLSAALEFTEKHFKELLEGEQSKEKRLNELSQILEQKEKQHNEISAALELKVVHFEEIQEVEQLKEKELDTLSQMHELKETQHNELSAALKLKEEQLNELSQAQELIEKHQNDLSQILEFKEKQINELSEAVTSKQKQLDELAKKMEEKRVERDSVCDNDQVSEFKEEIYVPCEAIVEKINQNHVIQDIGAEQEKSCSFELGLKGKQLEDAALNSKLKQTSNQKNEVGRKPLQKCDNNLVVNQNESQAGFSIFCITDGKALQMYLNERVGKHGSMKGELVKLLKLTSDPAKLVLEAMDGFFAPHLSKDGVAFEASVVRNTCLLLLEHLRDLKPKISKAVKKEAMKVANKWEAKLKVQGETEVTALAFLLLLVTYKLTASVNQDYLRKLCRMIDKHRLAPRLRQGLDELNRTNVSSGFEVEAVELDVMEEASALDSSSVKTSSDIRSLCRSMNANGVRSYLIEHVEDFDVLHGKILDALRHASDPAKLVLDICQIAVLDCDMSHADVNNTAWILLLDLLMKLSPSISIEVTIEAKYIAAFVRTRLEGSCKPVDHYKFLQFVASYKLANSYDPDELLSHFDNFFDWLVYQPEECVDLCFALGLAEKIPGVIKSLIDQLNVIRAVKYICVFAEEHTFPPVPILEAHLENVKKKVDGMIREKVQAERFEAKMLRQMVSCISTCKLESKLSPDPLIARVKELETEKERRMGKKLSKKRSVSPSPKLEEKRPRLGVVQQ